MVYKNASRDICRLKLHHVDASIHLSPREIDELYHGTQVLCSRHSQLHMVGQHSYISQIVALLKYYRIDLPHTDCIICYIPNSLFSLSPLSFPHFPFLSSYPQDSSANAKKPRLYKRWTIHEKYSLLVGISVFGVNASKLATIFGNTRSDSQVGSSFIGLSRLLLATSSHSLVWQMLHGLYTLLSLIHI